MLVTQGVLPLAVRHMREGTTMDREGALREHYDAFAADYVGVNQGVEDILSCFQVAPGASVLDIGCGTGNLTFRLPEAGAAGRIVGVDISDGVLAIARQHAVKDGLLNFDFRQGKADSLPFGDGEFDTVVSNMVFHLLPDLRTGFAESFRVLKPSGTLLIQMQGGGEVAGMFMDVFRRAWRQALPQTEPPVLVPRITAEAVSQHLDELGIGDFDIRWRHRTHRVPEPAVPKVLEWTRLVLGFWRWGLDATAVQRIEQLMGELARDEAAKRGYWEAVGNVLLIQATKPSP